MCSRVSARRLAVGAAAALVSVAAASCGDSGGSNQLDRIDGPAVVDPDFRPLDSVEEPRSTESEVPTSQGGG